MLVEIAGGEPKWRLRSDLRAQKYYASSRMSTGRRASERLKAYAIVRKPTKNPNPREREICVKGQIVLCAAGCEERRRRVVTAPNSDSINLKKRSPWQTRHRHGGSRRQRLLEK